MKTLVATLAFAAFLMAVACRADDLYIVNGQALGPRLADSCNAILWDIDTVFYNRGSTDATVTLLEVSNGGISPGVPVSIVLPAARASSIRQKVDVSWRPNFTDILWVYHLNVPANVAADSEMFPVLTNPFCARPAFFSQAYGKLKLPVFHGLVPASQQQVLTGLTLGDLLSHINVAIYNGGTVAALATVEMRRACDGTTIDTRALSVPANTIQQFGGFSVADTPPDCTQGFSGENGLNRLAYAVVTVDQPSISFASILANAEVPASSIQISGPLP